MKNILLALLFISCVILFSLATVKSSLASYYDNSFLVTNFDSTMGIITYTGTDLSNCRHGGFRSNVGISSVHNIGASDLNPVCTSSTIQSNKWIGLTQSDNNIYYVFIRMADGTLHESNGFRLDNNPVTIDNDFTPLLFDNALNVLNYTDVDLSDCQEYQQFSSSAPYYMYPVINCGDPNTSSYISVPSFLDQDSFVVVYTSSNIYYGRYIPAPTDTPTDVPTDTPTPTP